MDTLLENVERTCYPTRTMLFQKKKKSLPEYLQLSNSKLNKGMVNVILYTEKFQNFLKNEKKSK